MKQLAKTMANDFVQVSTKELLKDLKNMERASKADVKRHAEIFLASYEIFETQTDPNAKKAAFTKMYTDFFNFQNVINSYIGQVIKVCYYFRDSDGKQQLGILENSADHLNMRGKSMSMFYDYRIIMQDIKKVLDLSGYKFLGRLNTTEAEIRARWAIAKNVGKNYQVVSGLPILWKKEKWSGVFVNNLGAVSEAYAKYAIMQTPFYGNGLEEDVEQFLLDEENGVAAVDNASGFLIGDIEQSYYRKRVLYTVKKSDAGAMKVADIKNKLSQIMNNFDEQIDFFIYSFIYTEYEKNAITTYEKKLSSTLSKEVIRAYTGKNSSTTAGMTNQQISEQIVQEIWDKTKQNLEMRINLG